MARSRRWATNASWRFRCSSPLLLFFPNSGTLAEWVLTGGIVARQSLAAADCDADGDGAFDLDDLFEFVRNRFLPADPPLDVFDVDGDGVLTAADLAACSELCQDDDCTRFSNAV